MAFTWRQQHPHRDSHIQSCYLLDVLKKKAKSFTRRKTTLRTDRHLVEAATILNTKLESFAWGYRHSKLLPTLMKKRKVLRGNNTPHRDRHILTAATYLNKKLKSFTWRQQHPTKRQTHTQRPSITPDIRLVSSYLTIGPVFQVSRQISHIYYFTIQI